MKVPRCPECPTNDPPQQITAPHGAGITTLMWCAPFWDADGAYHDHDMNTTTTEYVCPRGHHWTESHRKSCPSCGWGKP